MLKPTNVVFSLKKHHQSYSTTKHTYKKNIKTFGAAPSAWRCLGLGLVFVTVKAKVGHPLQGSLCVQRSTRGNAFLSCSWCKRSSFNQTPLLMHKPQESSILYILLEALEVKCSWWMPQPAWKSSRSEYNKPPLNNFPGALCRGYLHSPWMWISSTWCRYAIQNDPNKNGEKNRLFSLPISNPTSFLLALRGCNRNDWKNVNHDHPILRVLLESVANTMVLLHYFAKVLRILRFWPYIRVHKGQGSKKNIGIKKIQMLKISMILRGLLVDTRLLVRRMFESVAKTMVLLQQECCECHGFG